MNKKSVRVVVIAPALAFLLAGGAAVAWACTPQTVITQLRPLSGPAGTSLTIEGSTPAPIEIRWNPDGPLLASASGSFAVSTAVPRDAEPGVYYLMAGDRALETFEVTGDAGPAFTAGPDGDLWSGFPSDSVAPTQSQIAESGQVKGSGQRMFAGLALLAVGFSGLGGALAQAARRRVRAHARST